jgi:hypothetical protein
VATIPLAAMGVKPPEQQPDLLGMYRAAQGIQQQQQGMQAQKIQIQQAQQAQKDQQAHTAAMNQWDGKDPNQIPKLVLQNGGSGDAANSLQQKLVAQQLQFSQMAKDAADTGSKNLDTLLKKHDVLRGANNATVALPDDKIQQGVLDSAQQLSQDGILDPQHVQVAQQLAQQPPEVIRQTLQQMNKGLLADSDQIKQAKDKAETYKFQQQGDAAAAGVVKNGPLAPPDIQQKQQQLSDRFQVLNPGKPTPPEFSLPQNATRQQYSDMDKAMEQLERAQGTKAQQDTANAMRQQAAATQQAAAADRSDKAGREPVTGKDKDGNTVLVSSADANKMGLTGQMKADTDLVNKSQAGRDWLNLATAKAAPNAPPSQMGIMQLVDKMDQDGKLGTVASRWNEFMAGKVGAGDPDFAALRAKMGLSTTKLMQAHVGSRGGAFMLEHFQDLADAGKMDAPTLKSALSSEVDYMQDVAKMPNRGPQGGGSNMIQARDAQGKLHQAPAGTALPAGWKLEQ